MTKNKTPEPLAKARKGLLSFHQEPPEKLLREAYDKPERLPEGAQPPPATALGWTRVDPLLAGLESVIPAERFAAINDKLQSIDALTIMVQNLRETSRADVLATAKRAAGGPRGGRGHKRDGSGNQATNEDIDTALDACQERGVRKEVKRLVLDAIELLRDSGKTASETRVRERRLLVKREKSVAKP